MAILVRDNRIYFILRQTGLVYTQPGPQVLFEQDISLGNITPLSVLKPTDVLLVLAGELNTFHAIHLADSLNANGGRLDTLLLKKRRTPSSNQCPQRQYHTAW